jgi:methyl-accepting chemotaxis protein
MGVMQVWHNRSVGAKVFAASTLLLVLAVGLGLFGLSQTAAVNSKAAEIGDDWLPSTVAIAKLAVAVREFRAKEANVVMSALAHDTGSVDRGVPEFRKAQAHTEQAYATFRPLIKAGTVDERLMKIFVAAWDRLKASSSQVLDRAAKGDVDGMLAVYRGSGHANIDEAMDAATADLEFNADEGKKAADRTAATYRSARTLTILAVLVCALVCIGAGFALIRSVGGPIRRTAVAVERLASGDLDVAVTGIERKDEIGLLARSLDVFKYNAIEARRLAMEQEAERAGREQRSAYVDGLVRDFEAKIKALVGTLAAGSTELEATSRSMTGTADRTKQRATMVATASRQTSNGVQTVAAAAEELAASVDEISRQVAQSTRITEKAVSDAHRTDGIACLGG